jgi:hypothetical protein
VSQGRWMDEETMRTDRWAEFIDEYERFRKSANSVLDATDNVLIRKSLVGTRPEAALLLLLTRGYDYREGFLPELLVTVADGPSSTLLLARDVLRSLRRNVLETRVAEEMRPLLLPVGWCSPFPARKEAPAAIGISCTALLWRRERRR